MPDMSHGAEIVLRLRQANRLLEELLSQCYGPTGISSTRVDVLELLEDSLSCSSQTDVARALGLSESTVCTLIERMQADGLLVRQRSATDRRRSVLAMSGHGQALLQIARDRRDVRLRQTFAEWTPEESLRVSESLAGLVSTLVSALTDESLEPSRVVERAA
ncbi:MarR family winged helix-turn-helix transcriptional regulator [Planctomyces sp. SH-PL14]|uniref:MarR family winged helix-turn-helix transcriptional regulator n=1 Tax=Planctomyces sp. SH-PL14 TaxID=1632864 RepID=UPI00078C71FA|nr:MarR family transcriptional regulator [Planctomyces sp. SH-PL14]AMV18500.1 MarR family protein [Planctomyces sp. SH-PL14]